MPYATVADLRQLDADFPATEHEPLPAGEDDPRLARLLDRAARDVDRTLGASYLDVLAQLTADQRDALRDACCAQALFLHRQGSDALLGVDDGIAAAGAVSFSVRPRPRVSPAVLEAVAGLGLLGRTLTVAPPEDDAAA